ncbi:MAG: ZIP family metal transporter [Alphaproteobacteria bacterium]|jgi:ZIP family zinc transporter|nr:ZIP family metal transporter [Alphaproteobacteria bacterium]
MGAEIILLGFGASLGAGLATGLGGLAVLPFRRLSKMTTDVLLGFSAGIMLAASFFSLLLPALTLAGQGQVGAAAGSSVVGAGFLTGGLALWMIHHYAPHERGLAVAEGAAVRSLAPVWLFVIAIALHNFPEGLAIGVGFGGGDVARGSVLAAGIALQNIPEGLAVAMALFARGYSRSVCVVMALLTGLVEPVGGLFGATAVTLFESLLPWALAFAAGAMIFVIADEIIPEINRREFERFGTFGLMLGFVLMMVLVAAFG